MEKITREEMINELEQYFEAAGFRGARSNKLESMNQIELEKLYKKTYNESSGDSDNVPF